MRKVKNTGMALVMALALSALGASTAAAALYKSEVSPPQVAWVTEVSEGFHLLKAGAEVSCAGATGESWFESGSWALLAESVQYTGCKVAGQGAKIEMNGCFYQFGEPTGSASPFTIKNFDIRCSSGKEIVITAINPACTIKVPAQSLTNGTTTAINSSGSPKYFLITAALSGIKYTGSGGVCGNSGASGTYSGRFVVKGWKSLGHTEATGIFVG